MGASLCLPWATQAYLPLAHIMELAVEVTCFAVGCRVGYGSPGTITPTALKMKQTTPPQLGDAGLLGPTTFVAAPAVLDKVLIAIKGKFGAAPPFIQKRIDAALKSGYANYDKGGIGAHWSFLTGRLLAFKKAQKLLGGRVELMLTGSAPLGVEVQKYVQTVFECRVRQGYGLTESCGAATMALASDNSTSCVGPPQVRARPRALLRPTSAWARPRPASIAAAAAAALLSPSSSPPLPPPPPLPPQAPPPPLLTSSSAREPAQPTFGPTRRRSPRASSCATGRKAATATWTRTWRA